MSGRTAAALCLAAFFATATTARRDWLTVAWSALAAAVEEPASIPDDEPEVDPGGGDGGWLIDPNG